MLSARGEVAFCRGGCAAPGTRRAHLEHARGDAGHHHRWPARRYGRRRGCFPRGARAVSGANTRRSQVVLCADPASAMSPADRATLTGLLLERGLEVWCIPGTAAAAGLEAPGLDPSDR